MATKLYTGRPAEPEAFGSVVRFNKYGGYQYAAINVEGLWYVTQSGKSRYAVPAWPWDEFLGFVGEEHWDTLELLS